MTGDDSISKTRKTGFLEVPCNGNSGAGHHESDGITPDKCVTAYGRLGSNGCVNEGVPEACTYSWWYIDCNGYMMGPYPTQSDTPVQPTTTDGPCS